jgi:5-methylcytosine-specific restriction enzyme A
MKIFSHLKDVIQGKTTLDAPRSPEWPKARKAWLAAHPDCAVCGGTKNIEVHHKIPFHIKPELELDNTNFISLCESKDHGVNCHLFFGHLGNFKNYNPGVVKDCSTWNKKLKNPATGGGE